MNAKPRTSAAPRLSVAMITRNEQDVILDSIRSVLSIADEVVVVDTGSTDQTNRLAEQLGARVASEPWNDDFSAARNRMLEHTRGDWILWLNAGEHMVADSARQLRCFLQCEAKPDHAYSMLVQLPPADPFASAEQAAQPRLLPKHAGLRFQGRVRETLLPSIEAAGLKLAVAPGTIIRHVREHDSHRKVAKAQRNLRLIAMEMQGNADPPVRALLALGEACADLGQQDSARQVFTRALNRAQRGSTEMLEAYYGLLATLDGNPVLRDLQLTTCLEALEVYPLDAPLLCAMGSYLQARNQLGLAARSFRVAMEHGQTNLQTWHPADLNEMAVVCLGLTLQLLAKDDEARQVFEAALPRYERSARIRRHLINLHVKHNRQPEALALVDRMSLSGDLHEAFRQAVLGACRASKKDWTAALGHLQSAYVAGCHDPFCLRWLSVTLLSNGQIAAATPVLEHWQQLEPANAELVAYLKAIADRSTTATAQGPSASREGRQLRIDAPARPIDLSLPDSHPIQPSPWSQNPSR
jgi:tetratricopeptide (TPR) repeat protein